MVAIAHITVAQAATVLNAIITVIQYTLALTLAAILVYTLPSVNTASAWNVITRMLHSSLWATLLRTDTTATRTAGLRVTVFSGLFFVSSLLVALAGVISPLGLKDGPPIQVSPTDMDASYVRDTSPLGIATSPRDKYEATRICGAFGPVICPGNSDGNTTEISPSIVNAFTSTTHGAFDMQFRQYYLGTGGYNFSMLTSSITTIEPLLLRGSSNIFAVEGLIVDLSDDNPGIGFWNHTFPSLEKGGVWSEEVLWLEPVTSCINTNLTIDYVLENNNQITYPLNLTDRGGFVNLTHEYPELSRDGQNIDIRQHAYKGAVLSNAEAMISLKNLTRNETYLGKTFPLKSLDLLFIPGKLGAVGINYLSNATKDASSIDISCIGYGGQDNANITNVGVHCSMFLDPPQRTDGGDPRLPGDNSTWSQSLHACASVTRARLQTVEFSFGGRRDISNLTITRKNTNKPVLWAMEKTDLNITDVDLFWGHVDDSYESDPSLSTIRSEVFYLPAGGSDLWGVVASGQAQTVPAAVWNVLFSGTTSDSLADYSGANNYALLSKFQGLIKDDPIDGPAKIRNLIWTDVVANNVMGNATASRVTVARNEPSVTYNFIYGIPILLLLILWLPSLIITLFLLITGALSFSYIKTLLNDTSVGRVVVGDSGLSVVGGPANIRPAAPDLLRSSTGLSSPSRLDTADWSKTIGQTPVAFGTATFASVPISQQESEEQKMFLSPSQSSMPVYR